jgi:signal transduction histidine kinase
MKQYDEIGMIKPFEKEYFRKDGSRIPVLVGASTFSEDTGITFVVDLSNLKHSRMQLEKINKELNTFLYMASHDLKGPLSTVKGLAEIARNESKEVVALKYIDLIGQSIDKLDKSLMNLLKIMKIKGEESEKEEIDFRVIIPEIVENLKNVEGCENVSITTDIHLSEPFIGDIGIINSVLQNLIENSIKYQSSAKGQPFVHIKITDNRFSVMIDVEDNGKGIDPRIKNKVFDMFYRGTAESKGSGLGLYIVKNAVEKVGGKIDFVPRPGGGTIFTLVFRKEIQTLT